MECFILCWARLSQFGQIIKKNNDQAYVRADTAKVYDYYLKVLSADSCYMYCMNERELTVRALNQLEFHTGLVATVSDYGYLDNRSGSNAHIQFDNNNAKLVAQLKRWSHDKDADVVVQQVCAAAGGEAKLLISDYINGELGARLRAAKVNYLDKVGNAYLDVSPIFVFIEGKVPKESFLSDKTIRLFNETGLKVICALLANDNLLNANYRTIADHANVSMGTIGWVLRELKDQRFTSEDYRERRWKNKTKLIETWVAEYPKLRAKHQLGVYFSQNLQWWRTIDLTKYDAALGGELAVINLAQANKVEPREGLIYINKYQSHHLIRDMRLIAPEHVGNKSFAKIEIRNKFWGKTQSLDLFSNTTHPFVTYADLMDTWDPANIELAKQLADTYLSTQ